MRIRKPIIVANWKMYHTVNDALQFIESFKKESVFRKLESKNAPEVVIAPSFVVLSELQRKVKYNVLQLGAQNTHWEDEGAFTGEVSVKMLKDAGCHYVILGHSERRHVFGESDDIIRKKVFKVLEHGLSAILCVGETLEERERNITFDIISHQLLYSLEGLKDSPLKNIVIAYEPVWAIGTGKNATPDQAEEVHQYIRNLIERSFGEVAKNIRIQYGGSVKPDNIESFMKMPNIDGALVGGASLNASSFAKIVSAGFKL